MADNGATDKPITYPEAPERWLTGSETHPPCWWSGTWTHHARYGQQAERRSTDQESCRAYFEFCIKIRRILDREKIAARERSRKQTYFDFYTPPEPDPPEQPRQVQIPLPLVHPKQRKIATIHL